MSNKFDELREKIKKTLLSGYLEEILLLIIDELEKSYNEIRQGFTRPK